MSPHSKRSRAYSRQDSSVTHRSYLRVQTQHTVTLVCADFAHVGCGRHAEQLARAPC